MTVFETRASTILLNLLNDNPRSGAWLLPANVCPVVLHTFLKSGRPFRLIDIDPRSLCLGIERLLPLIRQTPPAGIVFVRSYGTEGRIESGFAELKAAAPQMLLIDDRCLCRPTVEPPALDAVDAVLYSTGYGKPVNVGFGGFAFLGPGISYVRRELPFCTGDLTRLTAEHERAMASGDRLLYRDCDWLDTRPPALPWRAYREIVRGQIGPVYAHKRRLNEIYREVIGAPACFPDAFQQWRFNVRVLEKEALLARLFDEDLFASSHYADLSCTVAQGCAPVAERLHAQVVNLFNDFFYGEEQARRTAEIVREHVERLGVPAPLAG